MKINQIRLSNLNSLLGEWQIDLDHPMYSADGIFAITGPTGAGKSTILDAICLALYGRTPRLSKVNKSSNEVMSRQAGECFAEVTFETNTGSFVAHWSQHRSRKQSRGDLQNPKHALSSAATKEILESKLSLVPRRIEAETGMDFDRFTRSMLLAQGGFDTFLKADADDRAPILEQMTGTEIYSEISISVHERNRHEADLLKQLKAAESEFSVLSSEQVELLRQTHEQNLLATETLRKELSELTNNKQVLQKIADLETRKLQREKQSEDLVRREAAFEPDAEQLKQALRALELDGSYQNLSAKRAEVKKLQQEQANIKLNLPQLELQVSQQETENSIALKNQSESTASLNVGLNLFQQVRKLDSDIDLKQSAYGELSQTLQKTELEKKLVVDRSDAEVDALAQAETKLRELELWFEKNSIDAKLSDEIQLIFQRLDDAQRANEEAAAAKLKDQDVSKQLFEQKNNLADLRTELIRSTGKSSALVDLKDQAIANFETALAGQSLQQLEEKARELLSLQAPLGAVISCCEQLAELRKTSVLALAELGSLKESIKAQSDTVVAAQQMVVDLEAMQSLSQKNLLLAAKIVELESLRSTLKNDEACPLCGALDHPYVDSDNLQDKQPDKLEQELAAIGARLTAARVANEAAKLQQVKQQERCEILREVHRSNKSKAEKLNAEMMLGGLFQDQLNTVLVGDQLAFFVAMKSENEQVSRSLNENLHGLKQLQAKRDDAMAKSDAYKVQVEVEAKQVDEAVHQVALLEKDLQSCSDVLSGLKVKQGETAAIVTQNLACYGYKDISLAGDLKQKLSARLNLWQDQDLSLKEARSVSDNLKVSLGHLKERFAALDEALSKMSVDKAVSDVNLTGVKAERTALFSDNSVEVQEAKLRDNLKHCETIYQQKILELKALEQTLSQLKARLIELEELDSALVQLLQATETEFVDALKKQKISSEAAFVEAVMPPAVRDQLVQQQQALLDERKQLLVLAAKDTAELALELSKPIKLQVLLDVDEQLAARNQKQSEVQQEIGVITQKLEANDKQSDAAQLQRNKIEVQAGVCEQWKMLHDLIGSADGKKFRNFAQGLSFELMVVHANQQLKKMTDRYLLQRDIKQPLALNVIDFYQDAEVRSTKNLSGGESFIVSLALALGLSNMSSRQIRVDSLFLDEGFGTLDEEALEIALDTLSALQQTGKLIGVISHVAALKDRISTQIHVEPKTGGKSLLSGPGVQRLA